jgi:protein-L-isoaspartate(D-aspartate) O-methyltransferase
VRFDNEEPGRRSNALQAIGVDGRKVAKLVFTFRCRTERVVDGKESFEKAGMQVTFDDQRRFVGEEIAAHLVGTSPWQLIKATVKVPEGARQAVVRIGLNGATGVLWIDDVTLTPERRKSPAPAE